MFEGPTLARYTVRLFLARSLAFLVGLVVILQTLDLLGESGRILAVPGNGEAELWHYVALRLPQLISLFLPFSALLGALLTFVTLNQNSEIAIMKAAGLSPHRILAPLMLAGLALGAVNFVLNETWLVHARAEFDAWKAADYRPLPPGDPQLRGIWVRSGDDLVRAGRVEEAPATVILHDLTIYRRADDRLIEVIEAATARPVPGGWELSAASRHWVPERRLDRYPVLMVELDVRPQQFTVREVVPEYTPFWQLRRDIALLREAGRGTGHAVAELHHKVSGPMSAALMPLLAAVAAFGLARSGRLFLRAVAGLTLGFAFFVADNFALAMSDAGALPPWAAAWAPFFLFWLVGESVLIRSEE